MYPEKKVLIWEKETPPKELVDHEVTIKTVKLDNLLWNYYFIGF